MEKDTLYELNAEIASCDLSQDSQYNASQAQRIMDLLENTAPEDEASSVCPPLELLVYAIKSIIYPTFLYEQIPDFLRLLTMVEFYRQQTMDKVQRSLTFQELYKDDPNATLLLPDVKNMFEDHAERQTEWRIVFMRTVARFCSIDIQRLWLSGREAEFWVRFSEYFKYFEEEDPPEQLDHVFQHALSVDDIDILIDSYEECNNFITHTLTTAEEQREHDQSVNDILQSKDFHSQFPKLEVADGDRIGIDLYLRFVQELVQDVEGVFAEI